MPRLSRSLLIGSLALGIAGGMLGALLVWSLRGQLSVSAAPILAFVGWMLTLVGWFASARLSERAQRKMFRHQLINAARLELVKEIRYERNWVSGLRQLGVNFQTEMSMRQFRPPDPLQENMFWLRKNAEGRAKLYPERGSIHTLMMILEEYELLFPETREVRGQLGFFAQERIATPYGTIFNRIMVSENERTAAISEVGNLFNASMDYGALLEDLRVHIQNASLSEITGRTVSLRQPLNPDVPIMTVGDDGMLRVTERGLPWPQRTWPEHPWQLPTA